MYTKPNLKKSALITIDTQCDTLDGQPFEIPGTSAVVPKMATVIEAFRKASLPIIHIVRIYKPDGSNVDLCRRELVENGSKLVLSDSDGSQPAPGLLEDDTIRLNTKILLGGKVQIISGNEVIIYKPRWGAFYQTPLSRHLSGLDVDTLVFCGCNFPNCPRTSIYEASERDFKLILIKDAVSGVYERGLQELENIGVSIMSSEEIAEYVTG